MNNNGINKALAMVKSVAKKSTKAFSYALPIMSIASNVLDANTSFPNSLEYALKEFMSGYDGINRATGQFEWARFMKGTGGLALTAAAGYLIRQIA
jgi:hypothetical protein